DQLLFVSSSEVALDKDCGGCGSPRVDQLFSIRRKAVSTKYFSGPCHCYGRRFAGFGIDAVEALASFGVLCRAYDRPAVGCPLRPWRHQGNRWTKFTNQLACIRRMNGQEG